MENKYYTPDISEFFVGFEYDYKNTHDNVWSKQIFNRGIGFAPNPVVEDTRVKYLDKADIESLGFKQITDDCFNLPLNDDEELRLLYEDDIIVIFLADQYNRSLFRGLIKNKSELKKVLKQLNIVDEEEKKS